MTTTKSFNSSLENITARNWVVQKILFLVLIKVVEILKMPWDLRALGPRFVSCLVVGDIDGRASTPFTRYH